MNDTSDELLIRETLRLYRRYQSELVEGLDLCPWARLARERDQVEVVVSLSDRADPGVVLERIDAWSSGTQIEIGLLVFPKLELDRGAFERFASSAMAADAARHHLSSPQFVIAAFHPDAIVDASSPERLIPFWRRTPDPTLQIVRVSALARVRKGEVTGTQFVDTRTLDLTALLERTSRQSVGERVAQHNRATLEQRGAAAIAALFEDIHQDHARVRRAWSRGLAAPVSGPVHAEVNVEQSSEGERDPE